MPSDQSTSGKAASKICCFIQICLWMNLLILRNKLFRIYFLRIYTKLY